MNPGSVTIPPSLVKYLRRGVKRELSATLVILAIQVDTVLDPNTYHKAVVRFNETQALFEAIGLTDELQPPANLTLDLDCWPRLVLRALESQYAIELMRRQDAVAEGVELPMRDLPALKTLIADIRKMVGVPRQQQPYLSPWARYRVRRRRRASQNDG
jgi:hypothetical protein